MLSETGGFKEIRNLDTLREVETVYIIGRESSRLAQFRFDLRPPVHCNVSGTCDAEAYTPVDVGQDVREVSVLRSRWLGVVGPEDMRAGGGGETWPGM